LDYTAICKIILIPRKTDWRAFEGKENRPKQARQDRYDKAGITGHLGHLESLGKRTGQP